MTKKKRTFSNIYLFVVTILLYLPIIAVIVYSFNKSKTSIVWTGFTLDWYVDMFNNKGLIGSLFVSVRVALGSATISAILGTMAAVVINGLKPKLKNALNGIIILPLIMPEIVFGIALLMFFSLIPYIKYGEMTMIIAHTTFCVPYIYLMITIRLNAIEPNIIESAKDLGAKGFYLFKTIILPLILPSVFSGMLLAVSMSLDDVIISLFLSGPKSTTLPIKILSMLKRMTPEINALCTIMLIITFLIAGLAQIRPKEEREKIE